MNRVAAYPHTRAHLADELNCLDLRIRHLLATSSLLNDMWPQGQTSRTVYVSREEVEWLLMPPQPAAAPHELVDLVDRTAEEVAARVRASAATGVPLALPELGRLFGLSPFELQAVVVCLAPELRRSYDRIYAYLQDDITRRRPSVDLVLTLLCSGEEERWQALERFEDAAPLLRLGILTVVPDPASPSGSTALSRLLALDPRILQFLLGGDGLDVRLVDRARMDPPTAEPSRSPLVADLTRLAARQGLPADGPRPALVVAVDTPAGEGHHDLARQVSAAAGLGLLTVDLDGSDPRDLVTAAVREARLRRTPLCLAGGEAGQGGDSAHLVAAVTAAVRSMGGLVFVPGSPSWGDSTILDDVPLHAVTVPAPDIAESTELWADALAGRTPDPHGWAAELATRFRLTAAGVRAAVAGADRQRLTHPELGGLTLQDVYVACRQLSAGRVGQLAAIVHPAYRWEDLVLPPDRVAQLRDLCNQVRHASRVYGTWGFGARGSRGTGVTALFDGTPGTGKSMAAEVVAGDLGLDLYRVDLSGVVSKYVGETEKNLRRIFTEARKANAVLFFDEADALFARRTEVSDAHDRYANIETSFLLQEVEHHDGVVLLATNLRQNLDEAFTRRIRFVVEFPFPDERSRARIWRSLLPAAAPLADDVDVEGLAREFPVSGGTIRSIALNAAFLAAADGGVINRSHLLDGTRREYEKIGRLWPQPAGRGEHR